MAILIDIEMPTCCDECKLKWIISCITYIGYHNRNIARTKKCPLVEVDSDNLIDANKTIHAQIYNDQYEEFINKSMTIAEFLDNYTYDGCPMSVTEREVE